MRVLFCSFDSPGHLFPLVGLALEMRARGHQVAFATGLPAMEVLDAAGIERIPRGEKEGPSFRVNQHHYPVNIAIDVKHVEHAMARFGPDVLVTHQLCHAPHLVRERKGIPVAVMGLFAYLWSYSPAPAGGAAGTDATRRWRVGSDTAILNGARQLWRLPELAVDEVEAPFLGDLFLLRNVPELLPELGELPSRVHAVGGCLWEPPAEDEAGAWEALSAGFRAPPGSPLLYVQHGRTFGGPGFWEQLVEALAGRPVQVVGSVGRMDAEPGEPPANFLVRDHVPQGLVMPHARASVSGGHTSVVLAALSHGLPSVLCPSGGETPDNAEKLEEAGCALRLPAAALTAEALREGVERVLSDAELARSCRRIQRAFARMEGFARAAALVERLARTGRPVEREAAASGTELAGAPA